MVHQRASANAPPRLREQSVSVQHSSLSVHWQLSAALAIQAKAKLARAPQAPLLQLAVKAGVLFSVMNATHGMTSIKKDFCT